MEPITFRVIVDILLMFVSCEGPTGDVGIMGQTGPMGIPGINGIDGVPGF